MALTIAQLKALNLYYLTGADLLQFCPGQLLIKQYEVDNNSLIAGANFAYAEMISNCINRYDIKTELSLVGADTPDLRSVFTVKLTALLAIAAILGNAQAISEYLGEQIKYAKKDLLAIRNGQLNLPLAPPPSLGNDPVTGCPLPYPGSEGELVCSNFSTLG